MPLSEPLRFYLGTHHPNWLGQVDVPLFISHRRLVKRKTFPRASAAWALDSGAFTEIKSYGEWTTSPAEYACFARRYADEVGQMAWASPQDWMCEPFMLERTGKSIEEHQQLTVENVIDLRLLTGEVHFIPVLQGWTIDDYLRCWELYECAGITLEDEPLVGVGSVCRRQGTAEVFDVFDRLRPLKMHGFGVKLLGLSRLASVLHSSDSMAWSFDARRSDPMPGHTHMNCANCIEYALAWRQRVIDRIGADNDGRRLYLEPKWERLFQQIRAAGAVA
jgi:hypothetical protein